MGDTHVAASCSRADVVAAITAATSGDTVEIPAGTATWTSQIQITKGLTIIGAGISSTVITSDYTAPDPGSEQDERNYLFAYLPSAPESDLAFRLSGIEMQLANKCGAILFYNNSTTAQTKVRYDHIKMVNSISNIYCITGAVYGVTDHCDFCAGMIRAQGRNTVAWNNFAYEHGGPNKMYFEDNTIIGTVSGCVTQGEGGGRYAYRHNTITIVHDAEPLFDMHGNQSGALSCMGAELYENTIEAGAYTVVILDERGGKTMCFNNVVNTTSVDANAVYEKVREEIIDTQAGDEPATSPINGQTQHVSDSYFWGNRKNGVTKATHGITGTVNYPPVIPTENVEVWFEPAVAFDGTVGVGSGLKADRPATCTTGVGYWATDESTLYKATATNVWSLWYTPYTYPHPLRGETLNPYVRIY